MNKILNSEHKGFALTLEIMLTMIIITSFVMLTLFSLKVCDTQRYLNTVLMNTATMSYRWGGIDSNAYRLINNTSIIETAQNQLDYYFKSNYNDWRNKAKIYSSYDANGDLKLWINYVLPSDLALFSKVNLGDSSYNMYSNNIKTMSVTVKSTLIESGALMN